MKIKILAISLLVCISYLQISAQQPEYLNYNSNRDSILVIKTPKNALTYELLGAAGLFSLNYERIIQSRKSTLCFRIGAGFHYEVGFIDGSLPLSLTHLIKHKNNFLELGTGFTLTTFGDRFINGIIGYRFMLSENSKALKLNLNLRYEPTWQIFLPTPGIAFGFNF